MVFSVGSVLGRSWSIYMANLIPFFLLALVFQVPALLFSLFYEPDPLDPNRLMMSLGSILPTILGYILTGALTYGVFQQIRGRKVPIGDCISVGLSRLLPVLGVAIVAGIGIALGSLLLFVPGLILMCLWWVAVPVAVVERAGVGVALARSAELTRGYRWTVFGIIFVMLLILIGVGMVVGLLFVAGGSAGVTSNVGLIVLFAIQAFFTAWGACAGAVGYHDLRAVKENIDIEAIASVFD